jgi:hypothetical protein
MFEYMNIDTKIYLSEQELQIAGNKDWILTKSKITNAAYQVFGALAENIQALIHNKKDQLPAAILSISPKIYKGENYHQFPYVLLDYPRLFHKEKILAIRTMFWWGNYFSICLLVAGEYKNELQERIALKLNTLDEKFLIGISEERWEHEVNDKNFAPINQHNSVEWKCCWEKCDFIKIAKTYPIDSWNILSPLLNEDILKLLNLLED